jgi:flagellar basal-body rod protein FlgB
MINRLLSNDMMDLVQKSLDAAALEHQAISDNLANVDTPGFKRSEVLFPEKLKKALEAKKAQQDGFVLARTDPKHLPEQPSQDLSEINPELEVQSQTSLRNDQNNVDIDVEMAKLAQNTVVYQALAQITANQFAELKSAIREGK